MSLECDEIKGFNTLTKKCQIFILRKIDRMYFLIK